MKNEEGRSPAGENGTETEYEALNANKLWPVTE